MFALFERAVNISIISFERLSAMNDAAYLLTNINRCAFTLAEVLITLGIIGVVAAFTMPVLNQRLSDQKNISSLKKAYSILSQATNIVISEQEGPEYWGMVDNDQEPVTRIYRYYEKHFSMMRECENKSGCWAYPTKYLNGNVYWEAHDSRWYQYSFSLTDGMNILMDIYPADQIVSNFGMGDLYNYDCVVFWVDINADQLPNQIGRDIFAFIVTYRGLQPAGLDDVSDCNHNGNGWTCISKIIQDGWKIEYLK